MTNNSNKEQKTKSSQNSNDSFYQLMVCDPPETRLFASNEPQKYTKTPTTFAAYNINLPDDWGAISVRYENRPVKDKVII